MSEEVGVPYGDNPAETATLLLAAAEALGLEPHVVRVTSELEFMVPVEVNEKAFAHEKKVPAKKAAAKKSEE